MTRRDGIVQGRKQRWLVLRHHQIHQIAAPFDEIGGGISREFQDTVGQKDHRVAFVRQATVDTARQVGNQASKLQFTLDQFALCLLSLGQQLADQLNQFEQVFPDLHRAGQSRALEQLIGRRAQRVQDLLLTLALTAQPIVDLREFKG